MLTHTHMYPTALAETSNYYKEQQEIIQKLLLAKKNPQIRGLTNYETVH